MDVDSKYYSIINFYNDFAEPVAIFEKDHFIWANDEFYEHFGDPRAIKKDEEDKWIIDCESLKSIYHESYRVELYKVIKTNHHLASLTHEFRSPLNIILGIVEVFKETPLNSEQEKYLSALSSSSKTLMELVNRFLDMNKLISKKLELNIAEVNLENLISEIISTHALISYKKNNEISYYVDSQISKYFMTDELRLKQVIINILNNSIKFTENGKIHIEVILQGKDIVIKVSDTGIGIEDNKLKTIFKSYEQADNSVAKNFGGTGLGLAISKEIVELMKGEISVNSSLNKGTVFNITIPTQFSTKDLDNYYKIDDSIVFITNDMFLKVQVENYIKESSSSAQVLFRKDLVNNISYLKNKKFIVLMTEENEEDFECVELLLDAKVKPSDIGLGIRLNQQNNRKVFAKKIGIKKIVSLPIIKENFIKEVNEVFEFEKTEYDRNEKYIAIIDDNKDMLKILKNNLDSNNYIVEVFSNSLEAIEQIKKKKYDIVISDYYMPEKNGDFVFEAFCKNRKDKSLFIMMTGDLYNIPNEIIKEIIVLDKPIDVEGLQNLIDNFLLIENVLKERKTNSSCTVAKKILLVDDQEENYILLSAFLNDINVDINYINSSSEALETILNEQYDLIFLDMHMPIIDGFACAKKMREKGVNAPIVALSANALQEQKVYALDMGCNDYITKPVDKITIIEKVTSLITL